MKHLLITFFCFTALASAVEPPEKIRALLVSGGCCHNYPAQNLIIPYGIDARSRIPIEWEVVLENNTRKNTGIPLYDDPNWADGFDIIVHNECHAGVNKEESIERILAPHRAGTPAVLIHCAMHSYRHPSWYEFCGVHSKRHGPHHAYEVVTTLPSHPIMQGLSDWRTPKGELYFIESMAPTITPLAKSISEPTGLYHVNVWENRYGPNGTRVFGTTIGHHDETVERPEYLNMVTRGFLWALDLLDSGAYQEVNTIGSTPAGNLALGSVAKASHEETNKGNLIKNALDGDVTTRWCGLGRKNDHWFQLELAAPVDIKSIAMLWEMHSDYRYEILASTDGANWKQVVDNLNNKKNQQEYIHPCDSPATKHLRINMVGLPDRKAWHSIYEIGVYDHPVTKVSYSNKKQPKPPQVLQKPKSKTGQQELVKIDNEPLLKGVQIPKGFEGGVYAQPTDINYPTAVKATLTRGELYVACDKNGSLAREPNRGRIEKCLDTDNDGKADQFFEFVPNIDSPRGLDWDGEWLYVMHPPHVSRFKDTDGDHIADVTNRLVSGIAFSFDQRPADHTSNGITLGMDGWLYLVIGDFGFMEATGSDGAKLQLRGGGVVRVRPDGTRMHLYARGSRNIYGLAFSPALKAFARDNTNDGGGWDVRFHHFTGMTEHGYPSLYMHFPEDAIAPLADYGGGSGCGATWLNDASLPGPYRDVPITCDWGRGVFIHRIHPRGATFTESEQTPFILGGRATDLDVDAWGSFFMSSWKDGKFNYSDEQVGYVGRFRVQGHTPQAVPQLRGASDEQVLAALLDPRHAVRLQASREAIRRKLKDTRDPAAVARDHGLYQGIAVLLTRAQTGAAAADLLRWAQADAGKNNTDTFQSIAVRALLDVNEPLQEEQYGLLRSLLNRPDRPQTQNEIVQLIAYKKWHPLTDAVLAMASHGDPVIAHTARRALAHLNAWQACLNLVAKTDATYAEQESALKALALMHAEASIEPLCQELANPQNSNILYPLITCLTRLYHREGEWKGDSWGTRPDTSGPYYDRQTWSSSETIKTALKNAFKNPHVNQSHLINELSRNHITLDGGLETVLASAAADPARISDAVTYIITLPNLPDQAVDLLVTYALDTKNPMRTRAQVAGLLAQSKKMTATDACLEVMVAAATDNSVGNAERNKIRDRLAAGSGAINRVPEIVAMAQQAKNRNVAIQAWTLLLKLKGKPDLSPEAHGHIDKALAAVEERPAEIAAALTAIGHTRYFAGEALVRRAVGSTNQDIANTAKRAAQQLGIDLNKKVERGAIIATLDVEEVINDVVTLKGDPQLGEALFTKHACTACHTTSPDQPLKGPYLGTITSIYRGKDLARAILDPNATLAQGFVTVLFTLKDGTVRMGFITKESANEIQIRDVAGTVHAINPADIAKKEKLAQSMMPAGLMAGATVEELAAMMAYLEKLNQK